MSTKKRSTKNRKPEAVILDIEGTTTDISFVSKTLFPMLRSNFERFLEETYDSTETKDMIRRLRQLQQSSQFAGMPTIVVGSKQQVVRSVADNLKWQMKQNKPTSELKFLEILCWLWAYENNLIKAHLYGDVSPNLHKWKTQFGIKLYVYSSGIAIAQKLLFVNTNHGNIHSLIEEFFDCSIGSKTDPESYKAISKKIGIDVNKILFITDSPNEAKAAIRAGLNSVVIKRPGNKATNEYPDIPRINSFDEINF